MRVRTVGYIVAALTPFWLLALIAIQGRFFISPYEEFEYGPQASEKILRFGTVLRYTSLREEGLDRLDPEALDDVANRWIGHYRQGRLNDVAQIAPEDDGTFGFRIEIESGKREILNALHRDMVRKRKEKSYPTVAKRLAQIMEISSIAKYNSSPATTYGASAQMYALDTYESLQNEFTGEDRQQFFEALATIRAEPEFVRHTAERMSASSSGTKSEDAIKFPNRGKMALILDNSGKDLIVGVDCTPDGYLLAEGFRVAYNQEKKLLAKLDRFRLTALKTN